MTGNEVDAATVALCAGQAILARWHYELDTSTDDNYPFVSEGQLLLRNDGVLFQRVQYSHGDFSAWHVAPRAASGPYTPEDVMRIFQWPATNYYLVRIND